MVLQWGGDPKAPGWTLIPGWAGICPIRIPTVLRRMAVIPWCPIPLLYTGKPGPISAQVNFVLFVSIIRILLQKLTSPDVGGNDQSQYK